jgi:hypothetical protein
MVTSAHFAFGFAFFFIFGFAFGGVIEVGWYGSESGPFFPFGVIFGMFVP